MRKLVFQAPTLATYYQTAIILSASFLSGFQAPTLATYYQTPHVSEVGLTRFQAPTLATYYQTLDQKFPFYFQ